MQRHAISYQHKVMTFEPNIVPHTSNIRSSEPKLLFEIYSTPEIAVEYFNANVCAYHWMNRRVFEDFLFCGDHTYRNHLKYH